MGDAHDRLDDRHRPVELLQLLRLVRRAPDVRVGRVRLLGRGAVGQAALEQPLAHLLAAAELGHELRVEPGLVDAERGVREQAVAEEALDVVALVRRAVAPDVDAVLAHGVHEHRPGHGAAERRRVEVRLARARDVEGAALERDEPLVHELGAAVDELRRLGAVLERARRDVGDVVLVGLAEIGGEGVRDAALLADPGDGDGGVEPAGEGDPDALADGQGLEDATHRASVVRPRPGSGVRLRTGRSCSIARCSSPALKAPSNRWPDDPALVDDERERLARQPPLVDPAVRPLGGVVVLVDLDVDEVDAVALPAASRQTARPGRPARTSATGSTAGVAKVTTNGFFAASAAATVVFRSWRSGGSAVVIVLGFTPGFRVGLTDGIARSPTEGAFVCLPDGQVAERLDLVLAPTGCASSQYLPGLRVLTVAT